ncbi:MAG: hypothetical protein ABI675_19025 [Chitinophagaceae bacterium]
MKQTSYATGIYSQPVSLLQSASLQSSGKVQLNKLKLFLYPKATAMKTILTLVLALIIKVAAFSQLASFSAILKADKIDLNWSASNKKDINHFSIEKSTDGKSFSQAGIVFTYSHTSETMNYPFIDKNINTNQAGVIYYRINAVDVNGKTELVQVQTIRIGKDNQQQMSMLNLSDRATDKI